VTCTVTLRTENKYTITINGPTPIRDVVVTFPVCDFTTIYTELQKDTRLTVSIN